MPFVLGVRFENHTPFDFHGGRGAASLRVRRWLNKLQRDTLFHVADRWFRDVFPRHFGSGNRWQYNFEPREREYLLGKKREEGVGEGKNPNVMVVWKGESARAMTAIPPRITGNHNVVTVRVNNPPSYFSNPFVGTRTIETEDERRPGTTRQVEITVNRQPDKISEVSEISERDERLLRRFAFRRIVRATRIANRTLRKQVSTIR